MDHHPVAIATTTHHYLTNPQSAEDDYLGDVLSGGGGVQGSSVEEAHGQEEGEALESTLHQYSSFVAGSIHLTDGKSLRNNKGPRE